MQRQDSQRRTTVLPAAFPLNDGYEAKFSIPQPAQPQNTQSRTNAHQSRRASVAPRSICCDIVETPSSSLQNLLSSTTSIPSTRHSLLSSFCRSLASWGKRALRTRHSQPNLATTNHDWQERSPSQLLQAVHAILPTPQTHSLTPTIPSLSVCAL